MAKSKKKVAAKTKGLSVAVSRFGHDPIPVTVDDGATIQDVLNEAGIDLAGTEKVYVSGQEFALTDEVEDKDVVSIVTPKQACLN